MNVNVCLIVTGFGVGSGVGGGVGAGVGFGVGSGVGALSWKKKIEKNQC